MRETSKLTQLGSAFTRHLVGGDAVVAAELGHLRVFKSIAAEFSENRRKMPSKLLGNDGGAQANRSPLSDPTTFIHIDLRVGASHEPFLASDNPLVSIASRTSSLNPPQCYNISHKFYYGTNYELVRVALIFLQTLEGLWHSRTTMLIVASGS